MSDLIRRQDAIDAIEEAFINYDSAIMRVAELPSAIDLVRCKDCKKWRSDGGAMMICGTSELICNADDFCSYGERVNTIQHTQCVESADKTMDNSKAVTGRTTDDWY